MFAVIETGGKQVRVHVGDVVKLDTLPGDVGGEIVFDRVLMLGGSEGDAGDDTRVGSPTVDAATVRGSIVEHGRHKKIHIYTYKPRQNSNRKRAGHRQNYTAVKIESIDG
ncbi:MAG: 50S ribosomal protein L21 [Acidobacteriota bacterium]|nr:50S ribosomal protein L21 [Acidobacteriota bacterium]MDH3784880.1 50S ribosomal protein L21 [Acidobacteriota bacterium]